MATEAAPAVERWRFTTDDFHKMAEVGIFTEDDRVELIDGEIFRMTPIGGEHVDAVGRVNRLVVKAAGDDRIVHTQSSLALPPHGEPKPDFYVVQDRDYAGKLPQAEDVLLVVEVSDTSLGRDRHTKLPMYAGAGIPEAWLVDVNSKRIERHTEPLNGIYRSIRIVEQGERLESTILSGLVMIVDEVFPRLSR